MSIERHSGYYTAVCDYCGARTIGEFTFQDAVKRRKDSGWKSRKVGDEWEDICDECLRLERAASRKDGQHGNV